MTWLVELYAAQPFWVWLAVGVMLLAVEAMFSTEWLLWPAVAAGLVAVMTAAGFQPGAAWEVAIFAVLTVIATLLSRRLAGRVNPIGPDVNDREIRLIGQRAEIEVDAYDGAHIEGVVESIASATGAKFALLPPDNATGNFTKVVQRVPVRLRITKGLGAERPLRPGMSVNVHVATR